MGQARLRGTPERRRLQALEREKLETQKRIEEKAKEKVNPIRASKSTLLLATAIGLSIGSSRFKSR